MMDALAIKSLLDKSMSEVKNKFSHAYNTEELIDSAKEILLNQRKKFNILKVSGTTEHFKLLIESEIKNEDELEEFIHCYNTENNETLRIKKTDDVTSRSAYNCRKYYRCQHNTRNLKTRDVSKILEQNPSKRLKNTNCPFTLAVTIEKASKPYPCRIDIEWTHNHPVNTLQVWSFKDLTDDAVQIINDYFENGMTPGTAYKEYTKKLRNSYGENLLGYHKALADRSVCPRRRDFNKLYGEYNLRRYGGSNSDQMFKILEEKIIEAKLNYPGITLKHQIYGGETKPLLIAVVSPLMKRIHQHVQDASEIAFIDSSSNMEEFNLRVFLIVTQSVLGALPLGILITSDEKTQTLIDGFTLLKSCFSTDSFHGNGPNGPSVIMTDNCSELRDALAIVFPNSKLFLCTFHILQQVWRWICDVKHGVNQNHRPEMLQMFKTMVYASSEIDFGLSYKCVIENCFSYPSFQSYMQDLYDIKESWACCYRAIELIRGSNTNNYVESQFNVIKDGILKRCKEYNINGLLDKLLDEFESHYQDKLLSVASGTFDGVYSKRFCGKGKSKKDKGKTSFQIPDECAKMAFTKDVVSVGNNIYLAPSLSQPGIAYIIDMSLGICSCYVGRDGSPCKHQFIIWSTHENERSSRNFLPYFSKEERQRYALIATGSALEISFYEGLHDRSINSFDREGAGNTTTNEVSCIFEASNNPSSSKNEITSPRRRNDNLLAEAQSSLKHTFDFLSDLLQNGDKSISTGIIKFGERIKSLPNSRISSELHDFGSDFPSNGLKRKSRGKIGVQTESTKRRKSKVRSKQRQSSGRKQYLKRPIIKKRRSHYLSGNVSMNVNVPNKSKGVMGSKTKLFTATKISKVVKSS